MAKEKVEKEVDEVLAEVKVKNGSPAASESTDPKEIRRVAAKAKPPALTVMEVDIEGKTKALTAESLAANARKVRDDDDDEDEDEGLTVKQRRRIECELRRYIATKGGFITDLSEAKKKRCRKLLRMIDRKPNDLQRDYTILGDREVP